MNYLVPKSSLGLAAAGASVACFVGYCIYFDHKRRSDPQFKQKLLESKRSTLPDLGRARLEFYFGVAHAF